MSFSSPFVKKLPRTPEARPYFVAVQLEWDETGQQMRIRRGLLETEGVLPVLVPCQQVMRALNSGSPYNL